LQLIGGLGRVVATFSELPSNVILEVLIKVEVLYESPKLHKLREVFEGEIVPQGNLLDPCLVPKSTSHLPIFAFGGSIDMRSNLNGLSPM
jgi:hypothetical protein